MLPISAPDWRRILLNRTAARFLSASAVLSVITLALVQFDTDLEGLGPFTRWLLSLVCNAGASGFVSLLILVSVFWLKCDDSHRGWRGFWCVALLFGFSYGSSVLYYMFVYLPAFAEWTRDPGLHRLSATPTKAEEPRVGPFRRSLLNGWACLLLPFVATLRVRKVPPFFLGIVGAAFIAWSAVVLVESVVSVTVDVSRHRKSRAAHAGNPDRSRETVGQ